MVRAVRNDRRVFARFISRMPLKYKNLETGLTNEVFMRDVGGGGLKFITTEKSVDLNNILDMWIEPPNSSNPINIKGRVIWLREVGKDVWDVGIRFDRVKLVSLSRACNSLNALNAKTA